jgi:drug/metabolite transporter (DMT)-like permease
MSEAPGARRMQVQLLLAMAVWGLNFSVVKALTGVLDVIWVATIRMIVAALALSVLLWWRRRRALRVNARQALGLAACGVLMVYANQILFAAGLVRTSATNGALVVALSPLLSAILAALAFGERLRRGHLVGIASGFGGVAVVVLHRPGADVASAGLGDLLVLVSVLCFAAGSLVVQRLSRGLTALEISWSVYLVGSTLLTIHALLAAPVPVATLLHGGLWLWSLIAFSAVGSTAVAGIVWNKAISRLGAARTAMAFYWVPIFGVGFAALFLGEAVTWWHALGLAGVILGARLSAQPRAS